MTDRKTDDYTSTDTTTGSDSDLSVLYGTNDRSDIAVTASDADSLTDVGESASTSWREASSSTGTESNAKEHATAVARDAKDSGMGVASTAASEAKDIAREAKTQFRSLFDQLGSEATTQASGQSQRAVGGLRALSDELSGMAEGRQVESGMAADLARQGSDRLNAAASWLEGREPGDILDEVRDFARRRPAAFLAGAAVLGLVGARLTRGLTADPTGDGQGDSAQGYLTQAQRGYQAEGYTGVSNGAATATTTGAYDDATGYADDSIGTRTARIDDDAFTSPGLATGVYGEQR